MNAGRHVGLITPADISVIIPVANRPELLRQCLDALSKSAPAPREVIVVSDAAGFDIADVVKECRAARLIQLPFPVGTASARNAGALAAGGSVLFFVDADVQVLPGTIQDVVDALNAHPHAAAIIGSYDDSPAAPQPVSQYRNLLNHFVHQHASAEAFTFWGACGAIRAREFSAVGEFEPGHRLEDVELGYRLRRGGYRIALCPDLQVKHLKRWTLLSMIRADLFWRAMPWTRILLAYPDVRATGLNLGWAHRFSTLFALLTPLLLAGAIFWRPAAAVAMVTAALWLRINAPFLHFLDGHRGRRIALAAIPLHWVHSVIAGLGLIMGLVQHACAFAAGLTSPSMLNSGIDSTEESAGDLRA